MYYSKFFINTLKESPQEAEIPSHKLMLRAGLVNMLMAGVYNYLPMGLKVLENIKNIIREEMNAAGAQELLLSALQQMELWRKSGRDKLMSDIMITFEDRKERKIGLGPTHEEVITDLVAQYVKSYKQLPVVLYQIQAKFRDELRPRFGLVRCCEFVMKDAYSFDKDEVGLKANYELQYEAYKRIFTRCGINFVITQADSGVMGGAVSHEFLALTSSGEDKVYVCPKCNLAKAHSEEKQICPNCKEDMSSVNALEIGHVFQLGTKYSDSLGAKFLDNSGKQRSIIMGCYGIGVSRIISAVIEQNHDYKGIIWPKEISPFDVIILPLDVNEPKIFGAAKELHDGLSKLGIDCLLDDRDEKAGRKFNDADLLGIPFRAVLGKDFLNSSFLELKSRNKKIETKLNLSDIAKIKEILTK